MNVTTALQRARSVERPGVCRARFIYSTCCQLSAWLLRCSTNLRRSLKIHLSIVPRAACCCQACISRGRRNKKNEWRFAVVQPSLQRPPAEYHNARRIIPSATTLRPYGRDAISVDGESRTCRRCPCLSFTSVRQAALYARPSPVCLQFSFDLFRSCSKEVLLRISPLYARHLTIGSQPCHIPFSPAQAAGENSRPSEIRYSTTDIVIAQQVSEGPTTRGAAERYRQGRRLLVVATVQAVLRASTRSNSSKCALIGQRSREGGARQHTS